MTAVNCPSSPEVSIARVMVRMVNSGGDGVYSTVTMGSVCEVSGFVTVTSPNFSKARIILGGQWL